MADNDPTGASLNDVLTAIQMTNRILAQLVNTTAQVFPQYTVTGTTVGAAGAASALPATPQAYLTIRLGTTTYKIPLYNP